MIQLSPTVDAIGGDGGTEFYYLSKGHAINLQAWYLVPAVGEGPNCVERYGGIQMLDISFGDGTAFRVGGVDGRKAEGPPYIIGSDINPDKNWKYSSLVLKHKTITKVVLHAQLCPKHPHAGPNSESPSERIFGIEIGTSSNDHFHIGITESDVRSTDALPIPCISMYSNPVASSSRIRPMLLSTFIAMSDR